MDCHGGIPHGVLQSIFEDLNVQAVWNFDEFRPNESGAGRHAILNSGCGSFFRAMNNCWENGCTVSNFVPAGAIGLDDDPGLVAADFAPGVIGIRKVNLPDGHDQGGIKLEGVYQKRGLLAELLSLLPAIAGIARRYTVHERLYR